MARIFQLVGEQFLPVPGELLQISAGNRQSVWGINASSEIFRFHTTTGRFEQVPGQLTSISVGQLTLVWGINKSSDIFRGFPDNTFDQVPGKLTSISAGADGTVWGINASSGIFRFNATTRSFEQVPGSLASISAAADGTAWGINAASEVFRFNASTQSFEQVPGSLASISAAADGTAWGINAASEVFRFDPGSGSFEQVPSILNRVAASTDGSVWGINESEPPFVEPDQLDFNFFPVTFPDGTPVGGAIHLTLLRTGDYVFTGNFHDSGLTAFDLSIMVGVKDIANNLFSFSPAQGHVAGTLDSGSPDYIWNIPGHHPLVAQNWRTLAAGSTARPAASADVDLDGLIDTLIGEFSTVVGLIPILFGGQPTAPDGSDG